MSLDDWRGRFYPQDLNAFDKALADHLEGRTLSFSVECRLRLARGRLCDSPGPGSKAARARKSRPCGGRRSGSSAGRQGPVLGSVGSAVQVAEKLRKLVEEEEFGIEGGLTVSVGVAAHEQGDTVESLAVRADEALYRTKQSGKNCVYL